MDIAEAKSLLGMVSGVLYVVGFIPYAKANWRDRHISSGTEGKTEPSKASWLIWITLDVITLAGMIAKDSVNFMLIGCIAGGSLVMILALIYGKKGWDWLEKLCLIGAGLGIAMWAITGNPIIGMTISLSVTFLGSVPTLKNTWKDPGSEDKLGWTLFFISCCLALVAVKEWTFASAAQPIVFFTIEGMMMILLYLVPMFKKPVAKEQAEREAA